MKNSTRLGRMMKATTPIRARRPRKLIREEHNRFVSSRARGFELRRVHARTDVTCVTFGPVPRRWLVFVHQMPAHPSNGRVKIWRRLQQLGAIALKNAVHLLPDSAQSVEDFEWLRTEVVALGGKASIFKVSSMSDAE